MCPIVKVGCFFRITVSKVTLLHVIVLLRKCWYVLFYLLNIFVGKFVFYNWVSSRFVWLEITVFFLIQGDMNVLDKYKFKN